MEDNIERWALLLRGLPNDAYQIVSDLYDCGFASVLGSDFNVRESFLPLLRRNYKLIEVKDVPHILNQYEIFYEANRKRISDIPDVDISLELITQFEKFYWPTFHYKK